MSRRKSEIHCGKSNQCYKQTEADKEQRLDDEKQAPCPQEKRLVYQV